MKKLLLVAFLLTGCGEKPNTQPTSPTPDEPAGIELERGINVTRLIDRTNGVVCYALPGYYGKSISCVKVAP